MPEPTTKWLGKSWCMQVLWVFFMFIQVLPGVNIMRDIQSIYVFPIIGF